MGGRLAGVVPDYPDPQALAGFYSQLLGLPITRVDEDWVDISDGKTICLSFQYAPAPAAPLARSGLPAAVPHRRHSR